MSDKQKNLPAVSLLPVADDFLTCPQNAFNSNTFVFESREAFAHCADWRGREDFSAKVTLGYNRHGLCALFDITDSEVINEKKQLWELWMQDCVEFFAAAPAGRMFGTADHSFERLQLILSPPDAEGNIRSFTLLDSAYAPDIEFQAVGKRTECGYEIRLQIPYSVFGGYDLRQEKLIRLQISCNDYDRRDGEAYPRRRATLKQAPQPSASAVDHPLFRLCGTEAENPERSLELLWNPTVPGMTAENSFDIQLRMPECLERGVLLLQDFSGSELRRYEFTADEILTVDGLAKMPSAALRMVFTGYRNGEKAGCVVKETVSLANLLDKLSSLKWGAVSGNRKIGWMALVSAVEFLRMAAAPGSMNSNQLAEAIAECETRLALLEDRPLPEAVPEKFRYLELNRGFDAPLNICYSRGGRPAERNFTVITLPWGNIPCISAELHHCSGLAEAENMVRALAAYAEELPAPEVAGADQVLQIRGHLPGDGLRSDMEVHRLLSLYSSDRPGHVFRMPVDKALSFPVTAVCIMPDAPKEVRQKVLGLARRKDLPEIAFEQRDEFKRTLIAGTPDYPAISHFWHSRNGLPGEFLIVRRGNDVLFGSASEAGRRFIEFILAGKPLTKEFAREIAVLRMKTLPEGSTEEFAASQDLRTGDVHTHTIFSDGQTTPAGLLAQMPVAGFDFLVISDHDEIAGAVRLAENCRKNNCALTFFTGEEVTMAPRYHINVYPVSKRIDERFSWESIRRQAEEMNAVLQLNHPLTYGTAFSDYWYNDFTLAGFDAVERNAEFYGKWRIEGKGKLPVMTGSTDTHTGMLGNLNCTVVYAPGFSEESFRDAVKSGNAAMIDPLMPELVYGAEHIRRMVRCALADEGAPERFAARINKALAEFRAGEWIKASETLPAPYPRAKACPPEASEQEYISYPFSENDFQNSTKKEVT